MPSIKAGASGNDLTNTMRDSGKRVSQFSYIRVIACMAIVLLHTMNGARIYHMDTVSQGESLAAFTVCSVLMWAVPCFLMVSGALLLDPAREITWGKIFGKYIRRMLIALILFTAIFTVIRHDPKAGTSTVSEFFNGLAFNHCMATLAALRSSHSHRDTAPVLSDGFGRRLACVHRHRGFTSAADRLPGVCLHRAPHLYEEA